MRLVSGIGAPACNKAVGASAPCGRSGVPRVVEMVAENQGIWKVRRRWRAFRSRRRGAANLFRYLQWPWVVKGIIERSNGTS